MTAAGGSGRANNKATSQLSKEQLAKYAERAVVKAFDGSTIADNTSEYPKFKWSEMKLGKVLGKGGFGTVYEVRAFASEDGGSFAPRSTRSHRKLHMDDEVGVGEEESRQFIATHCLRNGGDARYAVKQLSPDVVSDSGMCLQGIHDMAVEARFLSNIMHPNIIKMRAMASISPYDSGFFIIMDRLYDTLEKRLLSWESRLGRLSGLAGKMMDRKGTKSSALYEERVVAAFDLSAAVSHLHDQRIIYRDLKPENIGFDIRGDIKIFDFGLAKELLPKLRNPDGTYKLTEMTGSPRYMAPEVANGQPYNETCDVYSFAILLWEILALKRPYQLYTPKSMRENVYNGQHKRPPVDPTWSNALKICLKRCWDADLHQRNSMGQVTAILKRECVAIRKGDDSGLEHNRRRSTFVFRPNAPANRSDVVAAANKVRRLSGKSNVSVGADRSKELSPTSTQRTVLVASDGADGPTEHEVTEVDC